MGEKMTDLITESPLRLKKDKNIKGKRFNYEIKEPIGRGLSGVVYRAKCKETQSDVAIKYFLPFYQIKNLPLFKSSATQQNMLHESERFHKKEIECLQQVNHPTIVKILDIGTYKP